MTEAMTRIIVSDHTEAFKFELDPARVLDARVTEEVNGEHSLSIETLQELEKADRLLLRDAMGLWHEYVVLGIEAEHTEGGVVCHSYYCVWSLQYDLSATFVNDLYGCGYNPGRASTPQPARRALECALEGTGRWAIGTITQLTESSASFYRRSGWEALQTVVEHWGGEIDATITVSTTGVVGRQVDLLAHVGSQDATRRFDYGHDVTGIRRTVSDDIWPCRIVPLGKSEETEAGGYTRRPSIEGVNGGVYWVEDASAVPLTRQPDGSGGWEYPTLIVKNDTYADPAELKAWAVEHVSEYCRPIVSYEAEVAQFERAGMGAHGVALGDEVAVVDRTFCDGGLRIQARVVKVEQSLLDPADVRLTIGNAKATLAGQLSGIAGEVAQLSEQVSNGSAYQATATYLSALLDRINDEANATGGYTYITEGNGVRTYDRAVSDPLVGAEATSVVEVKGGTIRIANSRTAAGDWDWKTVFTSGHIAAEVVTAARIVSGYIGSAGSGNYWDLDRGVLTVNAGSIYGGTLVMGGANNANGIIKVLDASGNVVCLFNNQGADITGNLTLVSDGITTGSKHYAHMGRITYHDIWGNARNAPGFEIYTDGEKRSGSDVSGKFGVAHHPSSGAVWGQYIGTDLTAFGEMRLIGYSEADWPSVLSVGGGVDITSRYSSGAEYPCMSVNVGAASITGLYRNSVAGTYDSDFLTIEGLSTGHVRWSIRGSVSTNSLKSRRVETGHYDERLLYCYETPSPMFGDIGSGTIDGDGTCIVMVDDIFSETARTDIAYQVFLQPMGDAEARVTDKQATHFVVSGTPGGRFDWELKAKQTGYEDVRLESYSLEEAIEPGPDRSGEIEALYSQERDYQSLIESLYGI